MSQFEVQMALLGVFLPIFGLAATFPLAAACGPGLRRWTILAVGPALTMLVLVTLFEPIAEVGHMLTVAIFLVFFIFQVFYYPALKIAGLVAWKRARWLSWLEFGCWSAIPLFASLDSSGVLHYRSLERKGDLFVLMDILR